MIGYKPENQRDVVKKWNKNIEKKLSWFRYHKIQNSRNRVSRLLHSCDNTPLLVNKESRKAAFHYQSITAQLLRVNHCLKYFQSPLSNLKVLPCHQQRSRDHLEVIAVLDCLYVYSVTFPHSNTGFSPIQAINLGSGAFLFNLDFKRVVQRSKCFIDSNIFFAIFDG